jgi:hypothetical protein
MPKQSTRKAREKPLAGLRGPEKCANSDEFRRLKNVERGEDPCFLEERKPDPFAVARRRAVSEAIARKRNCI